MIRLFAFAGWGFILRTYAGGGRRGGVDGWRWHERKARREGSYDFAPEETGEIPLSEPGAVEEEIEEVSGESAVAPAASPRKPQQAIPDRICPHCGFSIFGKTRGGRCPQCAAPLEHAATDLLQFSSPAWLRTMANGLLMAGAAVGAHVFAAALQWNQPVLGAVIHTGAAGLLLLGTLMATRMESDIGGKVMTGTGLGCAVGSTYRGGVVGGAPGADTGRTSGGSDRQVGDDPGIGV